MSQQTSFCQLVQSVLSTILLPHPIPQQTRQDFLYHLYHFHPFLPSQYTYHRLKHLPPTPMSFASGIGPVGRVQIPLQIWSNLGLPRQLPPYPPTPSSPPTSMQNSHLIYQFLLSLHSSDLIQLACHDIPGPPPSCHISLRQSSDLLLTFASTTPFSLHLPPLPYLTLTPFFTFLTSVNFTLSKLTSPTASGLFVYHQLLLVHLSVIPPLPLSHPMSPICIWVVLVAYTSSAHHSIRPNTFISAQSPYLAILRRHTDCLER